jgi:hypothetical protein
MGIDDEPADVFRLQQFCDAGRVSTLRQPKAGRFSAKRFAKLITPDGDLRMRSPRRLLQNRKNRVRRCTSRYFHGAGSTKLPKNAEQIAIPFFSKGSPRFRKKIAIKLRKGEHPFVSLVAIAFALKQSTKAVEMPEVTIAQKRIAQHCAQRGRYRQSDLEANAPPKQSLHHLQQRYVALADRLEKPVFLVKRLVLGMAYEWQVRVEDEGERAHHRVIPSAAKRSR